MASSNIKLFDENKGNMLTDTEFNISTQRLNGLQTGVASSQLQNKAMYQASLVAYAIAQVMMQNGLNANDTDAVSTFVANLSGTMLQKVYDIATTEEAQAGVATGKWMSPALVKASIDKTLSDKNFLQKSGGTMTGNLILNANPTANLGAATKQYVDTNINNVKTALTPVFGDLPKNGWFKFGDFTRLSGYAYDAAGVCTFLYDNSDKVTELVIVLKNVVLASTGDRQGYIYVTDHHSTMRIVNIEKGATATINRLYKLGIYSYDYGSLKEVVLYSSDDTVTITEERDLGIRCSYSDINSGTIELWYK